MKKLPKTREEAQEIVDTWARVAIRAEGNPDVPVPFDGGYVVTALAILNASDEVVPHA